VSPDPFGRVPLDERTHTYVVRIWEERRDIVGMQPTWRGSLDDVRTGGRTYFATLGELMNYLRLRTGMTVSPARARRRLIR
jgi:hypothetical protein